MSLGLSSSPQPLSQLFFRPLWIVCVEIGLLTTSLRALVTWTAFSALPERIRQMAWWMLVSEYSWVTSWGNLKTGTVFGVKSGDGIIGNTSLRWGLVTREARIKERVDMDMVLQCRCKWFHSDMELFNNLLWFVCYHSIVMWYRGIISTTYSRLVIVWKSANVDFKISRCQPKNCFNDITKLKILYLLEISMNIYGLCYEMSCIYSIDHCET